MSQSDLQPKGKIKKVAGPLVVATNMSGVKMYDLVYVGPQKLVGEIIELEEDQASIQVYEETSGLKPNMDVVSSGEPLSLTLGPGMLNNIYDGIQRPLNEIKKKTGAFITRGVEVPSLDQDKLWEFKATAKVGDSVVAGDIVGTIQETDVIEHFGAAQI